jgi:hypothetical protein
MGNANLVWSQIQIRLANQYIIYLIVQLEQAKVNIEGVKIKENFKVNDIMGRLISLPCTTWH